jgi:hypothetical protein
MTHRTPRRYRFGAMIAIAGAALFATSGVAAADTENGQHGHFNFRDNQSSPIVNCIYSGTNPYRLTTIVVKAPGIWWPDLNSMNNREHGKVGWQLAVQTSLPGAYGPWKTFYSTDVDKRTAYEDNPAYDPADKAPLVKWTLSFNWANFSSHPNAYARIEGTASWYMSDGSTMGTVTHDFFYYKWTNVPGMSASTTACPIKFVAI